MAIKVTLGEVKTQEEKPFPKLMKAANGTIVLFTSRGIGTCIKNGGADKFGEYSDDWVTPSFTDYNEPITIQNA